MAPVTSATLGEGVQLGAYRLIDRIGHGGMGEVWRAEHVLLGRHAAVKVLRATVSESEDIVTRFFNEARAAAAIADPGIVQIFDFGYHSDGCAYIVMELLAGETLQQRLERRGPLAVDDALRLIRQVASCLGAAHARGIVHRDLKPENVYIVRDPEVPSGERVKVLDFGIAKLTADPMAHATGTGAMLGTPLYMSPEQCRGAGLVDQRSDIYSLGCVLYTLLAGKPPFAAAGVGELLALHMFEAPPLVSLTRSDVLGSVDALIARCLEKDPAARFANASELAAELDSVVEDASARTVEQKRGSARRSAQQLLHASTVATFGPAAAWSSRLRPNTTLSASAGVQDMPLEPAPPRRATRSIALVATGAVAVGAAAWLALRPARPTTDTITASAAPAPTVGAPVVPAPAPTITAIASSPTPGDIVHDQIKATLTAARTWMASHAGAPCPAASDLAASIPGGIIDPWRHALVLTCTAQPADQQIGVISAGPDGAFGTSDDVASWRSGTDVTSIVAGPRWHSATRHPSPAPTHPTPSVDHNVLDDDGIPTQR